MTDQYILLKPSDENVFEELVTDIFMRLYKTYNFQRFGKKGQKQYGVDSVGPGGSHLIGIQCKNHPEPNAKISIKEIDEEIVKSEGFTPILDEYHIATSANRDTVATAHVLAVTKERLKNEKYPVYIYFWEDICHYLNEYPDLLFRYFIQNLPKTGMENLTNYSFSTNKVTADWPIDRNGLLSTISSNLMGVSLTSPYQLTVGLSSFSDVSFSGIADINIPLPDNKDNSFDEAYKTLIQLRSLIQTKEISKDLTIYPQTRIAFAFLAGWIFREVTSYRLTLVQKESQVWRTFDLPYVDPKITENLPTLIDSKSREIGLVFNISRDIHNSVIKHFEKCATKPRAVLGYSVEGYSICSSAQALSVARQLAGVIKNLIDRWDITQIHLFASLPAVLAAMITYHLNAICPITFYHLDESRQIYIVSGEIRNNQ